MGVLRIALLALRFLGARAVADECDSLSLLQTHARYSVAAAEDPRPTPASKYTIGWPEIVDGDICMGVTVSGAAYEDIFAVTGPNLQQYADLHGYKLLVSHIPEAAVGDENVTSAPDTSMAMVGFDPYYVEIVDAVWSGMQEAMDRGCSLIVWFDADTMAVNMSSTLTENVGTDGFAAFKFRNSSAELLIDGGMRALRRSDFARQWVGRIRSTLEYFRSGAEDNTTTEICRSVSQPRTPPEKLLGVERTAMRCELADSDMEFVEKIRSSMCASFEDGRLVLQGGDYEGNKLAFMQLTGYTPEEKVPMLADLTTCGKVWYGVREDGQCLDCGLPVVEEWVK